MRASCRALILWLCYTLIPPVRLAISEDGDRFTTWAGERPQLPGKAFSVKHRPRISSTIKLRQVYGLPGSNGGLPSDCTTYDQRYEAYRDDRVDERHFEIGNRRNPHSKYVVVLQMHYTSASLKEDLILATRAVAREVQDAGFHFYILYQVPRKELAARPEAAQTELTREEMLAVLPPDLRGLIIFHDVIDEYRLYYPKISLHAKETTLWGPGHRAPHAAISVFMHRYRRYQFAFVMEYDCRLTGGHWGRFLAAALQQAVRAEGTEADRSLGVSTSRVISTSLPTQLEDLPDLLAFQKLWRSDKWAESQVLFNETLLEEMKAMIYGGSRRLFDKMHELAEEGRSMYIESLLPAIPRHVLPGGKTVVVKIPMYKESFHCCTRDAAELYAAYYMNKDIHCPAMLLHPIKNLEPFWPESGAMASYLSL